MTLMQQSLLYLHHGLKCQNATSTFSHVRWVYLHVHLWPSCWPTMYWSDEKNSLNTNGSQSCTHTWNLSVWTHTLKTKHHFHYNIQYLICLLTKYTWPIQQWHHKCSITSIVTSQYVYILGLISLQSQFSGTNCY